MGLSTKDELHNYNRKRRRENDFGDEACAMCGETNAIVLERHHVGGRALDKDLQAVLCANCHRIATARQLDVKADLSHDSSRDLLKRLESWLLSVGSFIVDLGRAILEWGWQVGSIRAYLDERFPAWSG